MNSKSDKLFSYVSATVMLLLSLSCIFPILLLFMSSITSENSLLKNGYSIFPKEFGFDAYKYLWFSRAKIVRALIMPSLLLSGFAVIMMRTYFSTNIPDNIVEAAMIDGASELKILLHIVIPMSKPIISTVGLMTALAYWNDWLNGLYYLTKRTDLYTIQNLLNRLISSADFLRNNQANSMIAANIQVPSVGVRMAIAVIAIIPILLIYPFFQKGFVKGIVIGGVKG